MVYELIKHRLVYNLDILKQNEEAGLGLLILVITAVSHLLHTLHQNLSSHTVEFLNNFVGKKFQVCFWSVPEGSRYGLDP